MIHFILFAFIILPNGGYHHIGWYTDAATCRQAAKQHNPKQPEAGQIGQSWALCRCFSCGEGWP